MGFLLTHSSPALLFPTSRLRSKPKIKSFLAFKVLWGGWYTCWLRTQSDGHPADRCKKKINLTYMPCVNRSKAPNTMWFTRDLLVFASSLFWLMSQKTRCDYVHFFLFLFYFESNEEFIIAIAQSFYFSKNKKRHEIIACSQPLRFSSPLYRMLPSWIFRKLSDDLMASTNVTYLSGFDDDDDDEEPGRTFSIPG